MTKKDKLREEIRQQLIDIQILPNISKRVVIAAVHSAIQCPSSLLMGLSFEQQKELVTLQFL